MLTGMPPHTDEAPPPLESRTLGAPAPFEALRLTASAEGLTSIEFRADGAESRTDGDRDRTATKQILETAIRQLAEYFAGKRRSFSIPLAAEGTEFQRITWSALRGVPYGTTIGYRELAARMGRPEAVRAVAAANGRNPLLVVVPCHRVIGSDGRSTGYAGGLDIKRALLELEGVRLPAPTPNLFD
jgi:methylated-DNA-[protein]-cysteine S-methyltransferase